MKAPIYAVAPLFLLVLLGSCSKEDAKPTGLNNTKWRLTAQTREQYLKGSSQKYTYRTDAGCSKLNTITFAASGQVLWTRETGSCSYYYAFYDKLQGNVWGQWQLSDSPHQLRVTPNSDLLFPPNHSVLPVLLDSYNSEDAYDVMELSSTTLTLSKTYTIPTQANPTQDSVFVSYDTFTRIAE